MFTVVAEPNGPAKKTRKGGYVREFHVPRSDGGKQTITVYSDDATKLAGEDKGEIEIRPNTDFYYAV